MIEVIFLIVLSFIWICFAVVQDFKKHEIANWLNFSLIIFAMGFRFFYSLFGGGSFQFFYQGLIGLGIFFILGNIFYYGRMFAGGDAKLFFALGAILPFSVNFSENISTFISYLLLFLFVGAFYGLFVSFLLISKNYKNFKKEFSKQFKSNKKLLIFVTIFSVFFLILSFFNSFLIYFAIISFILPYLYLSAKSVDEVCMVKKVSPKKLTEGDWLYKDVRIGKKLIKKDWNGLTKKDIKLLQRKKFILIREGIVFSPVFLISFLTFVYLWFKGIIFI